jgi:hypothetical protein
MTHPAFSLELYSLRYALCAMRAFARANLYMDANRMLFAILTFKLAF